MTLRFGRICHDSASLVVFDRLSLYRHLTGLLECDPIARHDLRGVLDESTTLLDAHAAQFMLIFSDRGGAGSGISNAHSSLAQLQLRVVFS